MQYMAREEFVLQYVRQVRTLAPGIGGRKLWHMYCREFADNHPVGRDRFSDIIDRHGFKLRRRMRVPRTTDSRHRLPTYPNIVRDFIPSGPDRLIVSDITYIAIWPDEHSYRFCYLSLVLDAYTEEITGWSVGDTLAACYPLEALRMAIAHVSSHGGDLGMLIHHSDRGCQYASMEYVQMLRDHNIRISMTESGDPKDNARAERINNTMKNELLKGMTFHSVDEVRKAVERAVLFYNTRRPHMSIDMMTPSEARLCRGPLRKRWHSYREEKIRKCSMEATQPDGSLQGSPSGLRPSVNPCTG